MGSGQETGKMKESRVERNREPGSAWQLRRLPADTGASSRVRTLHTKRLNLSLSEKGKWGSQKKTSFLCNRPPSAWLYFMGVFDLPDIWGGGCLMITCAFKLHQGTVSLCSSEGYVCLESPRPITNLSQDWLSSINNKYSTSLCCKQ